MVTTTRLTMALMASGVTLATQSISLSNFTPRIENLPTTCQNAYTSSIQGCTKDDFASNNARCSSSCIQGLTRITAVVIQNCKGVNVPETSIIGVFLQGKGVEALCPSTQATSSSAARPPPPSSTQPPPPPPSPASTSSPQAEQTSSSSSTDSSSSTSNTPSSTPSSTQVPTQSSSSAPPQLSTAPSSPPPATSPTGSAQRSNQNNPGGGSPFEIGLSGPAPKLQPSSLVLLVMVGLTMVSGTVL